MEIQLLHVNGSLNRIVYNACKTYVAQLPAGGNYASLHDVVALSICNFELWPAVSGQPAVPLVSTWSIRERISGAEALTQVQYAFVELPKVPAEGPRSSSAEKWAWLFRDAVGLTAIPEGLSEAQVDALHLAEEATFSLEEAQAYRRVNDEIAQAEQLGNEGEARGEARGLRVGILDLCEALAIALRDERRALVERLGVSGLLASAVSWRCALASRPREGGPESPMTPRARPLVEGAPSHPSR